jgi:hypothetical protein
MSYDNTNKLSLWIKENDKGKYLGGSINVEGVEYFIDVYKQENKASDRAPDYWGKVKRKNVQSQANAPIVPRQPSAEGRRVDLDDDIPFAPEMRG